MPSATPAPTPGADPGSTPGPESGPSPQPTHPPVGTPTPTPPPNQRPRMLVQLQEGRNHHDSILLYDHGGGVTTTQAIGALRQLRAHPAIPRREQHRADVALRQATRWVQSHPPNGFSTQGYSRSFYFNPQDTRDSWRFDVVNLVGTNLRR